MEIPLDTFTKFIRGERATVGFIKSDEADNDSYYVIMAKIYGVVSSSAFRVDLAVADHTGKALFALRGAPAGDFFDEHLLVYPDYELITDPYALDDEWEQTYLFRIIKGQQTWILGRSAFIVVDICMIKPLVEQFAGYKMSEQEQDVYHEATSKVHKREFPTNIGLLSTNDFSAIHPNVDVGYKKRIYAPFQL